MRNPSRGAGAILVLLLLFLSGATLTGQEKKTVSEENKKIYDLAFEKALVHYEKAKLLYEKEKIKETAKELEAIVALEFPKGTETWDGALLQLDMRSFLGEIYLELKEPKKAVKVLEDGLKKAPEISRQTYQLYMTLGHVYKQTKDPDNALKAFQKAEEINKVLTKEEEKKKKQEEKKK